MPAVRKMLRMPFSELALLQREVNQLFERLAEFEQGDRPAAAGWVPSADVYECAGNLNVVVEVPGLVAESLKVACQDQALVITGERKEKRPAGGGGAFLCVERPQGRFKRVIPIDISVDLREARASLKGGLLTITLPRLKDRRGRETTIPVEREE